MTASPAKKRGPVAKPPTPCGECQREGGRRYRLGELRVCSSCKSRHDRRFKDICDVRGCSGVVRFGTNRPNRWCRSHEDRYQAEDIEETTSTIDYLSQAIRDCGDGCWEYVGRRASDTDRPQIWCNGLRWYVTRFLYVYFHGPHRGGLELHHLCGRGDCVRPEHLMALTRKQNVRIEGQKFFGLRRVTAHRMFTQVRIPKDPAMADELSAFTAGIPLAPNPFGVRY